ncbi:putative non-ribosomal peptide synthase [Burkholderia pseudomallei TSV5]|nr:putative non-ribosomal peptide synthase [Burkholderia pseudomallei TSV5]
MSATARASASASPAIDTSARRAPPACGAPSSHARNASSSSSRRSSASTSRSRAAPACSAASRSRSAGPRAACAASAGSQSASTPMPRSACARRGDASSTATRGAARRRSFPSFPSFPSFSSFSSFPSRSPSCSAARHSAARYVFGRPLPPAVSARALNSRIDTQTVPSGSIRSMS